MTRRLALPTGEPAADDTPGVEGNSRLTASTGIVLTVLLLVESFTILDVNGYITLHTAIGLALIGPLVLKSASTIYRFAMYYSGRADYVRRGAPPLLLRLIGPIVVLSSFAVIGTGIALLIKHGASDTWLTLHQSSFIVWIAFTGLHFLGHIYEAVAVMARDVRSRRDDPAAQGRVTRTALVVGALIIGFGIAAAFTPSASSWQMHDHFGHRIGSH